MSPWVPIPKFEDKNAMDWEQVFPKKDRTSEIKDYGAKGILKTLYCWFFGHKPNILAVHHEWGFGAEIPFYCTRCSHPGCYQFINGYYHRTWML